MRFTVWAMVVGLALGGAGCSKKADGGSGGGGGGGGGGAGGGGGGGAAEGPAFEDKTMEFGYSQFADGRKMLFQIQAQVPKGWKLMTEGDALRTMNSFMPAEAGANANPFNTSSLTLSATCHGQCTADKIPEQVAAAGASRVEMSGAGSELVQDEEVKPGVRVFVVKSGGGEARYNVGVSHWFPGQDQVVFCEALLMGAEAPLWESIRDACVGLKIDVVDPLVGLERARQEEANLAQCPAASKVVYTPKEPSAEDPKFERVEAVRAEASQPGYVRIYLANLPLEGRTAFYDQELQPGQGVVSLSLTYSGEGEVLSGKYPMAGEGPVRVDAGIRITGGVTLQVTGNAESTVEILARTPNRICGRFDLKDDWRSLSGEFVADFSPTR